jgi:hypothetical protein
MSEKPKTDKLKHPDKKLADNARTEKHVEALAKKIMEDPSFPLLHETARKMHEKHLKDK